MISKNPQYGQFLKNVPKDPKSGNESQSGYRYVVSENGTKCAIYANLENENEPITLIITAPTPKGGTGVLRALNDGPNGTPLYYQNSN